MSDPSNPAPEDAPLNPALKRRTETVYDTRNPTPDPLSTTGAKAGQGEGWPWIWLIVTIVCIALAIWFLL